LSSYKPKEPKILIIRRLHFFRYFLKVKEAPGLQAIVMHNPGNAQHTGTDWKHLNLGGVIKDWDIFNLKSGVNGIFVTDTIPSLWNRDNHYGNYTL